jgi:hypothetical protein
MRCACGKKLVDSEVEEGCWDCFCSCGASHNWDKEVEKSRPKGVCMIDCPVCKDFATGDPACDICNGSGKVNPDDIELCPACEGSPCGITGDTADENGDCSICSGNGYINPKDFYDKERLQDS